MVREEAEILIACVDEELSCGIECRKKSRKCLLVDFILLLFLLSPILKIQYGVLSVLSYSWL